MLVPTPLKLRSHASENLRSPDDLLAQNFTPLGHKGSNVEFINMGIFEKPYYHEPHMDLADLVDHNQGLQFNSDFLNSFENLQLEEADQAKV